MLSVFDSKSSKVLLGLAILLIAGFQYLYWLGDGGYRDHVLLMQDIEKQVKKNEELKERNRVLAAEVYDLKNGIEAIEEHARLDLGLIKAHETFVQMSTISTQYQPIYIQNSDADLRTNEDTGERPPEP
jgi:cell division protein FtsB